MKLKKFIRNYFKMLFYDFANDVKRHYKEKGINQPNLFSNIYTCVSILISVALLIAFGVMIISDCFSSGIGLALLGILGLLIGLFFLPFASFVLTLYFGTIFVFLFEFLLSLFIKSDKINAGIAFFLGGVIAIAFPAWLLLFI